MCTVNNYSTEVWIKPEEKQVTFQFSSWNDLHLCLFTSQTLSSLGVTSVAASASTMLWTTFCCSCARHTGTSQCLRRSKARCLNSWNVSPWTPLTAAPRPQQRRSDVCSWLRCSIPTATWCVPPVKWLASCGRTAWLACLKRQTTGSNALMPCECLFSKKWTIHPFLRLHVPGMSL